jgi:class 3 adenylate cyclase
MTGDGVMALFGAPIALEDASQHAIRSALAIHWEMARLSEQLRKAGTLRLKAASPLTGEGWGGGETPPPKPNYAPSPSPSREGRGDEKDWLPLCMQVGIHTGSVVVGTLGNDLRVEFKAVGDTVNLASRMEGLAEPYVTANTFKLTEGLFRFEGLGKKEVKGKAEPIDIYRVIAPSTRRTRFDVSAQRGLTPFVGRQLELLLDALDRAKEGRGQAVSIVADAGVSKSRLL